MQDDVAMLRQFVASRSEAAFTELVTRHLDWVYSAARRRVGGNSALAQDIAQTVFTDLARKAHSLPANVVLAAWLHRATQLAAAAALRAEARRSAREQQAMAMEEFRGNPGPGAWAAVAPLIDQALDRLHERERAVILRRFFRQQSLREVGLGLGISEDAARMRVERALHHLRAVLIRRGIHSTADALAVMLTTQAVEAAPVGLVTTVASAALATAAFPVLTSGFGVFQLMTIMKTKTAITLLAAVATGTTIVLEHRTNARLNAELLAAQAEAARAPRPVADGRPEATKAALPNDQFLELLRLRGQVGVLRSQLAELQGQTERRSLAAPEAKPAANRPLTQSSQYYPADNWANLGYQTPEATALTLFWALRKSDQAGYSGALGREMPLVPKEWAQALQGVKGVSLSEAEPSADGSLMVTGSEELADGRRVDTSIGCRQVNGQWLIHSLSGFPVEMLGSWRVGGPSQYSIPAQPAAPR